MKKWGLSSNQLKLLAVIAMTIDHIGAYLYPEPEYLWLRKIGRLALPIFAYMIAEGCHHTRSMFRYLLSVAAMAVLCQGGLYLYQGSMYMCILVTFSMSILLIWLLQKSAGNPLWGVLSLLAVLAAYYITEELPRKVSSDFQVDYGFMGVILPVMIWAGKEHWKSLGLCAIGLLLMGMDNEIQKYALLALIPLAFYSGRRGKYNMKGFFYWYYPAHLAIICAVGYLMGKTA